MLVGSADGAFTRPLELLSSLRLFVNQFVDCASITCCGSKFQLLQTWALKNVFQVFLAHPENLS